MREEIPMIEGKILEKSDIGREVWYIPNHAKDGDFSQWEKGVLSSFVCNEDGSSIFVKYRSVCGERTDPSNLKWALSKVDK